MKKLILLMFVLLSAPLAASASTDAADVQAIKDHGTLWSRLYEQGRVDDMQSLYEPDAWLMTQGQPVCKGVDAILGFLKRNKATGAKTSFAVDAEQIVIDGNRAFLISKYWMTIAPPDKAAVEVFGRSMLVFKRHRGGWRIWRDMDNSAPDVRAEDRPKP